MTYRLSILIPARNEVYGEIDLLAETITNVIANTSEACEVIAVLDGYTPPQPPVQHKRITYIHHSKSIGQRAATNEAARISSGKWLCKLDAHCAIDKDFDLKLLQGIEDDWTVVAGQYNLLVANWKCRKCDWVQDQGAKPARCGNCKSQQVKQVKVWKPRDGQEGRRKTYTHNWRFDSTLTFQYWGEGAADKNYCDRHKIVYRPEMQGQIHDTMCLLGACWAVKRERYFDLNMCDERFGSWGNQGVEIACKSWLSGGRLVVNQATWFAHFFRVGGINFPYEGGGRKERAVARSKELWLENKWEKQVRPLSWLIEKFAPVPDWGSENKVWQQVKVAGEVFNKSSSRPSVVSTKPTKCALYYTCNSHDLTLELAARNHLRQSVNGHEVGCVSRERTDFGDWNVVVQREKSGTTMHYQILEGLKRSSADYVFLCESDVMYHSSHFDFIPERDDVIYYNTNVWRIRYDDGHAVRTDGLQQVSGICASRKFLLDHYRRRIEWIEANQGVFDVKRMAYEPGTRGDLWGVKVANWESTYPNIDITGHGKTLTKPKFSVDEFRNKRYAAGWQETDDQLPGWPRLSGGGLQQLLKDLANGQSQHIEPAG